MDDTAAVQAAFTWVQSLPTGGTVYFPAGTFKLSAPIYLTTNNIAVRGAGRGVTVLRWDALGGFSFSVGNSHRITVAGVSLKTTLQNGGTAISIAYPAPPPSGDNGPQVLIEDIEIVPSSATSHWWTKGIEITNARGVKISRFHIGGHTSHWLGMSHGIRLIDSFIVALDVGIITSVHTGVYTGIAEGTYISRVEVVGASVGFWLFGGGGTAISDCHTNTWDYGIKLISHNSMAVTGNLIYKGAPNNFVGIQLENSPFTTVTGNQVAETVGGAARNGIMLDGTSSNCTITGNILRSMDTGVWLTNAAVANNIVSANRGVGVGATVINWGTGNLVVNNL